MRMNRMRIRLTEVLKFLVAAAIGFTLRVMVETTREPISSNCLKSKETVHHHLDVETLDYQLREPFVPRSSEDVIEYRFINKESVFDSHGASPQHELKSYQLRDLQDSVKQTMNFINSDGNKYRLRELHSGYERIDPLRGKEYLFDLEVTKPSVNRPGVNVKEFFRISSVKPFTNARIIRKQHIINLPTDAVHLIVPMHVDQENAFYRFLQVYESHVSRKLLGVTLTLVVFSLKEDFARHDIIYKRIEKRLNKSRAGSSSPRHYRLRILRTYKPFSSHEGRNTAVTGLPRNAKLVFTDLNVNLTGDFYLRCRATLVSDDFEGGQANVYSPIPYSVYKMTDMSKSSPANQLEINRSNGYWDHENFQTICLTKATFENAGGYDVLEKTKTSWEEDRNLFARLVKHQVKIIRSVDPAVFISYHEYPCITWANLKYMSEEECKRNTLKSIGSRTMLAKKLE